MASSSDLEASRVNLHQHAENVRLLQSSTQTRHLPVTIITGFLGAGKTTLLNHILTNKCNLRIAAAINDFAELNIDKRLIRNNNTTSKLIELTNGCVCCHLLDDLQSAVWHMLKKDGDVDMDNVNYLVIETSGISDPSEIIRTLDVKFGKMYRARLDSVVTVIDADQFVFSKKGSTMAQAAVNQMICADVILMNKMDLLAPDGEEEGIVMGDEIENQIRCYNRDAKIYRTEHCNVPLSSILDVTIMTKQPSSSDGEDCGGRNATISHERSVDPIYVSSTGGALRRRRGGTGAPPSSSGSFIPSTNKGSDVNLPAAVAVAAGVGADHLKADKFVSLAITLNTKPLSLAKLSKFITSSSSSIRQLARMKGVLWIDVMCEYRCVLHLSGRGRLNFELDGKWTGPPSSDMAFIGSSFDEHKLRDQFTGCVISEESELGGGEGFSSSSQHDEGKSNGLEILRRRKEFQILDNETIPPGAAPPPHHAGNDIVYFRLTGSQLYGYTEKQIERDLRIDSNKMNMDLADAVNATVVPQHDKCPKAFLPHTKLNDQIVLCYVDAGAGEGGDGKIPEPPMNDFVEVLLREASKVLSMHFRNVRTCKCGT